MTDPTLKIRITGDLESIKQQLKQLGGDFTDLSVAGKKAGKELATGFTSAEHAAKALNDQLGKGADAVRAQRDAARESERIARQTERNAEAARLRAARAAERDAARVRREQQNAERSAARQASYRAGAVAPQLTDIGTQLAGGQNPLLVLLQQGGQIRDIFGGIRPAIAGVGRALVSLVGPVSVTVGAFAALVAAYVKGQNESLRFNRALIQTGGASGETADNLREMSRALDDLDGSTVSSASATLATIVESGKFAREQIEAVARAAEQLRSTTGRDVEETVGEFAKLAGDPTTAVEELNRKYGFLNGSILEQIRALQQQGRTQEAATLAIKTYSAAIDERAPSVRQNLGLIERGWKAIKDATREAVDAALEIGRQSTGRERFDELFQERQDLISGRRRVRGQDVNKRIQQINEQLAALQDAEIAAQKKASKDQAQSRAVTLQNELANEAQQFETAAARRIRQRVSINNRANEAIAKALIAGDAAAAESVKASRDRLLAALDKQDQEEATKEQESRQKAIRDSIRSLEDEAVTFGLATEEVVAYQLALLGATDAQIARGREAARALEQLKSETAATKERAEAEKELAEAMADVRARLAEAEGNDGSAALAKLQSERDKLLASIAKLNPSDQESINLVNRLFDVESARLRAQAIEQEARRLISNLAAQEGAISSQIGAGLISQAVGEQQLRATREETIAQLIRQRDALQAAYDTAPSPETLAAIQEFNRQIGDIGARNATGLEKAMMELRNSLASIKEQFTGDVISSATDSLATMFESIANGSKSAGDAVRDFVRSFAAAMLQIASRALATYFVLSLLDAIYPGLGKMTAASFSGFQGQAVQAGVSHTGGVAGRGGTIRMVNPAMFARAPRYHGGGVAGLAPNEVPAILERGEEVLSKGDPRNTMNGGGQGVMVNNRIVNVFDEAFVTDQMNSASGEQVVLNIIARNPNRVRGLLG